MLSSHTTVTTIAASSHTTRIFHSYECRNGNDGMMVRMAFRGLRMLHAEDKNILSTRRKKKEEESTEP